MTILWGFAPLCLILPIISETARNYIRKYHHILIAAGFSERACEAFDLLSRKELIKIRPIELGAALYDGIFVKHDGWVPTEVYLTDNVEKHHRDLVKKTVMSFFHKATKKDG